MTKAPKVIQLKEEPAKSWLPTTNEHRKEHQKRLSHRVMWLPLNSSPIISGLNKGEAPELTYYTFPYFGRLYSNTMHYSWWEIENVADQNECQDVWCSILDGASFDSMVRSEADRERMHLIVSTLLKRFQEAWDRGLLFEDH